MISISSPSGLSKSQADTYYLKLDCSNDPLTGDLSTNENILFLDSKYTAYGGASDMLIYYDGTNGIVNPRAVGAGNFVCTGAGRFSNPTQSSGTNNEAFGSGALNAITSSDYNTALGKNAGAGVTSGLGKNSFFGFQAGNGVTTSTDLVIMGYNACQGVTSGMTGGVYIGSTAYNSGYGEANVVIGRAALLYNSTVDYSVVIGDGAYQGSNATGDYNTFIGYESAYSNVSGGQNVVIGVRAGYTFTNDSNNIMIGAWAGYYETGGSKLFIDSLDRTNEAGGQTKSLIYGGFNATVASQFLTVNAGTVSFNAGTNTDLTMNFTGTTTSGVLKWMEDEDYFEFVDTVLFDSKVVNQSVTQTFCGSKTLTDEVATGFVDIAVGSGEMIGGNVDYAIYVSDATPDYQAHMGGIGFVAVNKGGTVTSDCDETYVPASEIEIVTAGTLTDAFTCTNGAGKITLNCNVNTSLANATITLKYKITMHSLNTITAL